jgi:Protein of unknown function (DUF1353)
VPFVPKVVRLYEGGEENPDDWSMASTLRWTGTFRGDIGVVLIPASESERFDTDLASVPRALTWLVPRYGRYTKAAILHDYLCQHLGEATVEVFPSRRSVAKSGVAAKGSRIEVVDDRSDADEVFRLAMTELRVPWGVRWLMWTAVSWATLVTSLRTGRSSTPAVLRWIGRAIVLVGAASAIYLFVRAGGVGFMVGDPDWRWFRIIVLVLLLPAVAAAGGAVAILPGGYVAQGSWHRWLVYIAALLVTLVALPVLAVAALVALAARVYRLILEDIPWVLKDAFRGFPVMCARLRRMKAWLLARLSGKPALPAPTTARSLRIEAVRES